MVMQKTFVIVIQNIFEMYYNVNHRLSCFNFKVLLNEPDKKIYKQHCEFLLSYLGQKRSRNF